LEYSVPGARVPSKYGIGQIRVQRHRRFGCQIPCFAFIIVAMFSRLQLRLNLDVAIRLVLILQQQVPTTALIGVIMVLLYLKFLFLSTILFDNISIMFIVVAVLSSIQMMNNIIIITIILLPIIYIVIIFGPILLFHQCRNYTCFNQLIVLLILNLSFFELNVATLLSRRRS